MDKNINIVKFDVLDKKILLELIKNSRKPTNQIAKKVLASREVVQYRIKQLEKKGVIADYYTQIDYTKLGWISAVIFLKIKVKATNGVISYIKKEPYASWSSEFSGNYDIGTSIYGKSIKEIDETIQKLLHTFEKSILSFKVFYHKDILFNTEHLFNEKSKASNKKSSQITVTQSDKKILQVISTNPRLTSVEIAKQTDIEEQTVRKRLKNLENNQIIQKYSILLNNEKLNLLSYNAFFHNSNSEEKKKLKEFIKNHKSVYYIVEYHNSNIIEAGITIKSQYELKKIISEIEECMPSTKKGEIVFIQKDLLSFGLPKIIFT